MKATFIGVTTILFDDGKDQILIDGFFSRPSLFSVLCFNLAPNEKRIDACLQRAGIDDRLRAVFASHSHYDHLMDAPYICQKTGAQLVGSESTKMFGLGNDVPSSQIDVVADGDVLEYGAFRVTVFEGIHSPGDRYPGAIMSPLKLPCPLSAMRTGKVYSWLIEHGNQKVFVHPRPNSIAGKLQGVKANAIFLGAAVIGKETVEWRERYWRDTVEALGATRVFPVHWDNFWRSLDAALSPIPWPLDRWDIVGP